MTGMNVTVGAAIDRADVRPIAARRCYSWPAAVTPLRDGADFRIASWAGLSPI